MRQELLDKVLVQGGDGRCEEVPLIELESAIEQIRVGSIVLLQLESLGPGQVAQGIEEIHAGLY